MNAKYDEKNKSKDRDREGQRRGRISGNKIWRFMQQIMKYGAQINVHK